MKTKSPHYRRNIRALSLYLAAASAFAQLTLAADNPEAKGTAPAGQIVLQHTRGGAIFVAEPLKREYDALLARVQSLQSDLDHERISGPDAQSQLKDLKSQLDVLRQKIDTTKTEVTAVKVHKQSQEITFELGADRLLVITADNIRVKGWDGPGVKCVLEKTVMTADENPVDDQMKAIKVVHQLSIAPELVGRTAAERDAEEKLFKASLDGARLTEQQYAPRRRLLQEISASFAKYETFQGKQVDTLAVEGLTHEQGNRWIGVNITSPKGGESHGGDWQRHAELTIYVPACQAVAVRGCLEGVDIEGLHASLILTNEGSLNRDYDGKFAVRHLVGSLLAENAPLDLLDGVQGNVTLHEWQELSNTGTTHDARGRTLYTPSPRKTTIRNIEGDLVARFTRGDLSIEALKGRLDLINDFGDTLLKTDDTLLESAAHRVVTQSGRITLQLKSSAAPGKLPLKAFTECGTLHTNAPESMLATSSFTLGADAAGQSGAWRSLASPQKKTPDTFFDASERVMAALRNEARTPGLDIISRGGLIRVMQAE